MSKKALAKANRALARVSAQLDTIQIGERIVPVTQAIADLEATGRKYGAKLGEVFTTFDRSLISVAREMVPTYEAWCKLVGVPERGSADLWLTRIDPDYHKVENRIAGTHSMSVQNRWRNVLKAYALDGAKRQLEDLIKLDPEDRATATSALEDSTRKAIAKLDLSEDEDLTAARVEIFGLPAAPKPTDNPRPSANDIRNSMAATILALTPADQRIQIVDDMIKRMALTEGAAKTFRTTGIVVKPWFACKTPAENVRALPMPAKVTAEATAAPKTAARKQTRRRAA